MTVRANVVSGVLRRGGLRPLPSGTSRMREGIRVTNGFGGAWVAIDVDSRSLERTLAAEVTRILGEAGYEFTPTADRARFHVTGRKEG